MLETSVGRPPATIGRGARMAVATASAASAGELMVASGTVIAMPADMGVRGLALAAFGRFMAQCMAMGTLAIVFDEAAMAALPLAATTNAKHSTAAF